MFIVVKKGLGATYRQKYKSKNLIHFTVHDVLFLHQFPLHISAVPL